jgi:hypothetical protein
VEEQWEQPDEEEEETKSQTWETKDYWAEGLRNDAWGWQEASLVKSTIVSCFQPAKLLNL